MDEKQYKKHGVDNMTISINKQETKQEHWHDDWKGTAVFNDEQYHVNIKIRNDTWMVGTFAKMQPKKEEVNQQPMEETNEETSDTDGDEIPF